MNSIDNSIDKDLHRVVSDLYTLVSDSRIWTCFFSSMFLLLFKFFFISLSFSSSFYFGFHKRNDVTLHVTVTTVTSLLHATVTVTTSCDIVEE